MPRAAPEDYEPEPPLFSKPARVLGSEQQSEQSKSKQEQNMSIGSKAPGPGPNKSGSKGASGPSTKMASCATNAGSAHVRGGAKPCGYTGAQGAQPNKASGSKGSG